MKDTEAALNPTQAFDEDDVAQEAFIIQLTTGKRASKHIIRKKLFASEKTLYGSELPEDGSSPWPQRSVNLQAIQDLVNWTLTQTQQVQESIWEFLRSPEEHYPKTLQLLEEAGVELHLPGKKTKKTPQNLSVSEIIRRALRNPCTKEDLISFVQDLAPETSRPAARVRQFLRRHLKKRLISYDENTETYSCKEQ